MISVRADKFTTQLQSALGDAQSLAIGNDHSQLEAAHLFMVLLEQSGGTIPPLLLKSGVNVSTVSQALKQAIDKLPTLSNPSGEIQISQNFNRLLNLTDKLAQQLGDSYISSELVLLAALKSDLPIGGVLREAGVSADAVENAIQDQFRVLPTWLVATQAVFLQYL